MEPVPDPYFITFELVIYATFGLCLVHAWRSGSAGVWQLVAGVVFGLLLEWATIQQLEAYTYGRFLLMLGAVPVPIGVAWGTIIYSARQYSNATSLPGWARPLLDALLALNIDLSMDALAVRLGFWNWAIDIDAQYFGVPWANFWAWFWVVVSFSSGLRWLAGSRFRAVRLLAPLGAVAIGVGGVLVTNLLILSVPSYELYVAVVVGVVLAALLVVALLRPRLDARPRPALTIWVPAAFHAYFLGAGVISGVILQPPLLLVVSLAMAAAAAALHWARGTGDTRRQALA
jgi:uncharacterized membrane protein